MASKLLNPRGVAFAAVAGATGDPGSSTPPLTVVPLNVYDVVFVVTVLSATTSVKSRIMLAPGACRDTSGSHAHGASDASSFWTLVSFRRFGSSARASASGCETNDASGEKEGRMGARVR